ncbi:TonB-dependent siderophore receptor [uncultured Lacinutrix sp.]|uniref:TonB-dependent receptor plug domain-containing protein n=1 Tax=uncultured Lacinutrix sp. TaxID=574032 RepID=UPI00260651A9|nr:TonB-dependent receptor plug domain-containing protein [uncultured Lacinutrix sp.]
MIKFTKLTLFVFFFGCFTVFSQDKKQPLAEVLNIIEQKFKVNFSYADADINNINIVYIDANDLDTILVSLEKQTKLIFNKLNNEFITISNYRRDSESFNFQKLENVVISNYLTTGIYKNNTGSITIKPSQFGILPGLIEPDVLQTIQSLPGVLSADETISNINIRGGTHDQNLLLYDGIKMYQSGHFFGLISAFNPYLTNNVSVYKNGTSAKYGDGVSSVIDMRLSDNLNQKHDSGLGINSINVDGFALLPLSKKTELQIAARRSITDIVNTPTYNQYFERIFQDSDLTNEDDASISKNENFYFYDLSLKFLYDISKKDKLRFNFLNIYNALNYEEQAIISSINEASESKLKQKSIVSGISYQRHWNNKISTDVQFYYSNYDLDAINYDILNDQRLIQENKVIDNGFKFEANYNFNKHINLNAGFQFSEIGISNLEDVNNPLFRSSIKRVIRSYAGYMEVNYFSKNKSTLLKIGVRDNYYRKFNMHIVEPRLHFSQQFLKHFRAEISGEYKSQSTSQIIDLQNDFLGIEKRRWVLANNTTIPIIKSKQTSLGVSYNKNKLLISAEAYIKQVDGITTRSQGFLNQYQFVNAIGGYQIKGVDFLINKQFNNQFNAWLSYSYSSNLYTFNTLNNGKSFPNNVDIRHVINFASTYTLKKLKIGLGFNWHSGKPNTAPIATNPIFDNSINYQAPNSSRLDDYLRADFSTTYQFKLYNKKAIIGASIWNILNKKNTINSYYIINNETVSKVENISLGLTPNISFRVSFN